MMNDVWEREEALALDGGSGKLCLRKGSLEVAERGKGDPFREAR